MTKKEHLFFLEADRIISGRKQLTLIGKVIDMIFPDYIYRFMIALRKVEYYMCQDSIVAKAKLLYFKLKLRNLSLKLGFSIPPGVFGYGLYIPHHGTIVVNKNAKVGAYCVLHTCTCIAGDEHKVIGDNVYISTGSVISGEVTIADDTRIGANSFVNKSFTNSGMLIAGSPAKTIKASESWFRIDGSRFNDRIIQIEKLKTILNEKVNP